MNHLLTSADKAAARKEYRLRLLSVGLFLALGAFLIFSVSLLPSLFFNREKQAVLAGEFAAASSKASAAEEDSLAAQVAQAKREVALLAPDQSPTPFDALHGALRGLPAGISVTGFFFSPGDAGHIRLTGTAASREKLVAYQKQLVATGLFTGVDIPLSDFAGASDIDFSVNLSGAF